MENPQQPFNGLSWFMNILAYGWVILLSMLGGAVSFVRRVRRGETKYSNLLELIGEFVVSSFSGLVTFFLCKSASLDVWLSAAFVGISGNMGTRLIFFFESFLLKRLGADEQQICQIEQSGDKDHV